MKFDSPLKKQIKVAPAGVMENPNFRQWFGQSSVINSDGSPKMIYHGTDEKFDAFKPSDQGIFGKGIYLTSCEEDAMQYCTGEPMKLFASIQRPFVTQADYAMGEEYGLEYPAMPMIKALFPDQVDAMVNKILRGDPRLDGTITRVLRELGHDGIQVNWADGLVHYIALRCNQVKSATGNDGSFSMLKASIYE